MKSHIKIFTSSTPEKLEERVNQFLEGCSIDSVQIHYQAIAVDDIWKMRYSVCVQYLK